MTTRQEISAIVERTQDAFSRPRYTDAGWAGIARRLATLGFTLAQIEWVLRSKHMRWAADAANREHSTTAADFFKYTQAHLVGGLGRLLVDATKEVGTETRRALTGADLAGACEGEDIADLIDLAQTLRNIGGPSAINLRASKILSRIEGRHAKK